MNASGTRTLRNALAVSMIALLGAGCYYVPTHRYHDGYRYYHDDYGYRHYVPHTDLSITYFGGSYGRHRDHDRHWRGVPYRHYGAPHYRGERHPHGGHERHGRGHHRGDGRWH